MKSLNITDNGEVFFPKTAYDAAVYYVSGNVGGATVSVSVLGNEFTSTLADTPELLVHGTGAPVLITVAGGSGVDLTVTAYPVE